MGDVTGVLNVVLLGKTGAGKSSSGNTILGRQAFISKKSSTTVTLDVAVESGAVEGFSVTVYDTPGLSDIDMSEEEIEQMINEKVLQRCASGRSVFLLVIKADRFTEEERRTVEKIEKMLGENNQKNSWILFTRGDELEEENTTIQEFIDETKALKTLVQKYEHRYHLFNNKNGSIEQVKILFTKIKTNIETMGALRCHPLKANMCPQLLAPLPLCFHAKTKGSNIVIDETQLSVWRSDSFCDAITFTNRPVRVYEQVQLKITKTQGFWSGALKVGFSIVDPSNISCLPQFACPNLVERGGFWAKSLPEEHCEEGTILSFWLDNKGQVFYSVKDGSPTFLFCGVPAGKPAWAIIELFGKTCGVQLFVFGAAKPSRRIVLLGERCVGKRAARETILGQKESARRRGRQVTYGCSEAQGTVSGRSVSVVITPGFFDTYSNPEQLMMEIARSVCLFSPGLHAFLIVFTVYMGFTEQELQIPQMTEKIFGEEVLKYSIILFTHGDWLEEKTIEKLIEKNSGLRSLVQQCGGRYHVFNNSDMNNREQVEDLLQKIDSMVQQNGGAHYTDKMYENAQRARQAEESRLREGTIIQIIRAVFSGLEPIECEGQEEMERLGLIACAEEEDETERLIPRFRRLRLIEQQRKKEERPTLRLIERVREEAELMLRMIEQLRKREEERDTFSHLFYLHSFESFSDSQRPSSRVRIGRMIEKEEEIEKLASRERIGRMMEEVREEEEEEIKRLTSIEERSRMMEEEEEEMEGLTSEERRWRMMKKMKEKDEMESLRSKLRTRCCRMRLIEQVREEVEDLIRQLRDRKKERRLTGNLREEAELTLKMIEQLRKREKEENAIDELKLTSREWRQRLRERLKEEMERWRSRGIILTLMRPIRERMVRQRLIEQMREEREMERKRLLVQMREEEEMERRLSLRVQLREEEEMERRFSLRVQLREEEEEMQRPSSIERRLRLIEQVRQKVELTLRLIRQLRDMEVEESERMTCVIS